MKIKKIGNNKFWRISETKDSIIINNRINPNMFFINKKDNAYFSKNTSFQRFFVKDGTIWLLDRIVPERKDFYLERGYIYEDLYTGFLDFYPSKPYTGQKDIEDLKLRFILEEKVYYSDEKKW